MLICLAVTACLLFAPSHGAGEAFSYDAQQDWPGVCVSGNTGRQSPINILTASLTDNSDLMAIQFSDAWTTPVNGYFQNKGQTAQFDPTDSDNPAVTTQIHLGTYRLRQMHMHWGRNDTEGSEHTVNGQTYSLELHFVQEKEGTVNSDDRYAVIGVFAQTVNTPISGVWSQLDASAIQSFPSNISVSNLVYNNLLPPANSRDYYHYVGSLTTPGCDEIVQWFVLRTPIQVPAAYIANLRQLESLNANETITFNFRDVQPLGSRSVYQQASGAPKTIVSTLSIVMAMFVTITLYLSF